MSISRPDGDQEFGEGWLDFESWPVLDLRPHDLKYQVTYADGRTEIMSLYGEDEVDRNG